MSDPPRHVDSLAAFLSGKIRQVQHRNATALGVDEHHRKETVMAMLANNAQRVPGYWIQLFLSMGIATLGLVLNSTAVVIGAMLVSPLMGPILELGMGLAVGSSLLVLRSFLRVVSSIALVIACSSVLVLVLPFHEMTAEITARVAPTALDLLVAVFCALTAAYTTVRPGSDAASAAAGTAIGIALVPPLCTVGFGIGTGASGVASGSALLFTANLSAIVLFAVFSFLLLGFNQVDATAVERDFLEGDGRIGALAGRVHRALGDFLGSRYGLATRLLMPALMLTAVFVPLRRALKDVTWEVRARDAVRRIVHEEIPGAMQTSVSVEGHGLSVKILSVSSNAHEASAQLRIVSRLQEATGVVPIVSLVEVADARQLSQFTTDGRKQALLSEASSLQGMRQRISTALAAEWPGAAGPLVGWEFTVARDDSSSLQLRHLGEPLQFVGSALIARALSSRLGSPLRIVDVAMPSAPIVAIAHREQQWLDSAVKILSLLGPRDSIVACVRGPGAAAKGVAARDRAIAGVLRATPASARGRVEFADAERWAMQISVTPCGRPTTAPPGATR